MSSVSIAILYRPPSSNELFCKTVVNYKHDEGNNAAMQDQFRTGSLSRPMKLNQFYQHTSQPFCYEYFNSSVNLDLYPIQQMHCLYSAYIQMRRSATFDLMEFNHRADQALHFNTSKYSTHSQTKAIGCTITGMVRMFQGISSPILKIQ